MMAIQMFKSVMVPNYFCCYQACDNKPNPADLPKESSSLFVKGPGVKAGTVVAAVPWSKRCADDEDTDYTDAGDDDHTGLPWPRLLSLAGDHPLLAALRLHGRHVPSMQQELFRIAVGCGDDLRCPSDRDLDILRRLATQHETALGPRAVASNDWFLHEKDLATLCEYGAAPVGDLIQWFRIIELDGCDLVKGFAAFLEVDLMRNFAPDLMCADPLGMHTAKRDAGWRSAVRTRPHLLKEDNVWLYHALDALDAPVAALLIFAFTPPRPRIAGVPCIPQPEQGFMRSEFDCTIHHFEPIMNEGAFSPTGFRITQMGVSRPPAGMSECDKLSMTAQCIKDGTGDISKFVFKLRHYIENSCHLEARMKASPRTELYERIGKHVDDLWPCVVAA